MTSLMGLIDGAPNTASTDENVHPNMAPGCAVSFSDANQSLKGVMFEDTLDDEKSAEGAQLKPTDGCTLPSATESDATDSNHTIQSDRPLMAKDTPNAMNSTLTHRAPVDSSSELDDTESSFVSQSMLENGTLDVSEIDSPKTEMMKVLTAKLEKFEIKHEELETKHDKLETKFETKIDEIETKNEDELKSVHKKIDQTSEALTNVAEVADEKLDAVRARQDKADERSDMQDDRQDKMDERSDVQDERFDFIEEQALKFKDTMQQVVAVVKGNEKREKPRKVFNFRPRRKPEEERPEEVAVINIPTDDMLRKGALEEKRNNGELYAAWTEMYPDGADKPSAKNGGNVYMALRNPNFRKIAGSGWNCDEADHRRTVYFQVDGAITRENTKKKKLKKKEDMKKNE